MLGGFCMGEERVSGGLTAGHCRSSCPPSPHHGELAHHTGVEGPFTAHRAGVSGSGAQIHILWGPAPTGLLLWSLCFPESCCPTTAAAPWPGCVGTPGPVWVLPGGVGTPWWPGRTGQGTTAGSEGMGNCPGQCEVLQEGWWCHGDTALSHSRDRAAPCPGCSLQRGVTNSWHPPGLEMSFNQVQPPT